MNINRNGFSDEVCASCRIGLGSPHFGQGVYFKELLTELPATILGSLLYTIET